MQVPFCNLLRACSLYHLQILSLSAVGVCAAALTSHTPKEEANATLARLGAGGADPIRLLYLTPEKIVASKRIMAKLEKLYQVWCVCACQVQESVSSTCMHEVSANISRCFTPPVGRKTGSHCDRRGALLLCLGQ